MDTREERIRKLKEAKEQLMNHELVKKENSYSIESSKIQELKNSLSTTEDLNFKFKEMSLETIDFAREKLKEVSNEVTEMLFIFDKSGSCMGTEEDTINGFLSIIEKEKRMGYQDLVTTCLFESKDTLIHDREKLQNVSRFTYFASGGTALYDALGKHINRISNMQDLDNPAPDHTLVVIMTDGGDNESVHYNRDTIRDLIRKKKKEGWQFIYLGVYDVKREASLLGIEASNAVEYQSGFITNNFRAMQNALDDIHQDGIVHDDWHKPITDSLSFTDSSERLIGGPHGK